MFYHEGYPKGIKNIELLPNGQLKLYPLVTGS